MAAKKKPMTASEMGRKGWRGVKKAERTKRMRELARKRWDKAKAVAEN